MRETRHHFCPDTIVSLLLPLATAGFLVAGSCLQLYSFAFNDFDYTIFSNLLRNLANGNGYFSNVYSFNFLRHHFVPAFAVFTPLMALVESVYTLAVIHALAFAATFLLMARAIRTTCGKMSRNELAAIILAVFVLMLINRPFMAAWRSQAHATTLFLPVLVLGILCLHGRRLIPLAVCVLLLLTIQERGSVSVFSLGMYGLLVTRNTRLGIALCAVSTVYFFTVTKVLLPFLNDGVYYFADRVGPLALLPEKAEYLFRLMLMLGCLPLLRWRTALCAFPMIAMGLASNSLPMINMNHQYDDMASIFLFLAAAQALQDILIKAGGSAGRRLIIFLALCLVCANSWYYGRDTFPGTVILRSLPDANVRTVHGEMSRLDAVPQDATLFAPLGLAAHSCLRDRFRLLEDHILDAPQSMTNGSYVVLSPFACNRNPEFYARAVRTIAPLSEIIHNSPALQIFHIIRPPDSQVRDDAS